MKKTCIGWISAVAIVLFVPFALAETAEEKAAFALNTNDYEVTVTDMQKVGSKVKFKAHYDGGIYNCYYAEVMLHQSDALCSGPVNKKEGVKPHSGVGCNDLLRAAGRCE